MDNFKLVQNMIRYKKDTYKFMNQIINNVLSPITPESKKDPPKIHYVDFSKLKKSK
jgi:hypothetical protein